MSGGTMQVADRILSALAGVSNAGAVVMLASTEEGCGGYGRVIVDPWHTIEVRMFGWPMLEPGNAQEASAAVASMLHLGFAFDGTDWIWRRRFLPELVPVATHAAARALAEAWSLSGAEADRLLHIHTLDVADSLLVVAGEVCSRCIGDCAAVH